MKKILIALLALMPTLGMAQDNTWERIEQEPVEASNPDAKYLLPDAVPVVDGKVCWTTTLSAPGKSAKQIYDILLAQLEKMVKEPNQIGGSAVVEKDTENHKVGAVFHEWLVFKNRSLSLDRTQFNFTIEVKCYHEKAEVIMSRITYDYDLDRDKKHYTAEEWITDEYAVNKNHTKLYPISDKFRRKTIDRKDFIFNKFNSLLNDKK